MGLLDPLGDLVVAADQGGARPAVHQADARPEVGVDLQAVAAAAVQGQHAPLSLGPAAGESGLHGPDRTVSGSKPSNGRFASAHACAAVSRVMACSRIPKRSVRPSFAAGSLIQAIFFATSAGGSPQVR